MKLSRRQKRQMVRENRSVAKIMRIFEMKQSEITDPAVAEDIEKLITALNSGQLQKVVKQLNSPGLKTAKGHEFLESGDLDKDKVTVTPNKPNMPCNKMKPTQSQIFATRSAAYTLSDWNTVVNASKGKFFGGISIAEAPGNTFLVLDGHHRWSGAMCLSNDAKFKATVYEFWNISH
jgi:hypothetical protein